MYLQLVWMLQRVRSGQESRHRWSGRDGAGGTWLLLLRRKALVYSGVGGQLMVHHALHEGGRAHADEVERSREVARVHAPEVVDVLHDVGDQLPLVAARLPALGRFHRQHGPHQWRARSVMQGRSQGRSAGRQPRHWLRGVCRGRRRMRRRAVCQRGWMQAGLQADHDNS